MLVRPHTLWRRVRCGTVYRVVASARAAANPRQTLVVYEQMHPTRCERTGALLAAGTAWVRPEREFLCADEYGAPRFQRVHMPLLLADDDTE